MRNRLRKPAKAYHCQYRLSTKNKTVLSTGWTKYPSQTPRALSAGATSPIELFKMGIYCAAARSENGKSIGYGESMKTPEQLAASIERFREGFWGRRSIGRPPIGVGADRAWQPIGYLRAPLPEGDLAPSAVNHSLVRTDYEDAFAARPVTRDDWMPYCAAWRGVPWIEAMCGCPVRASSGSLAPGHCLAGAGDWRDAKVPAKPEWTERLRLLTEELVATAPADCWVSTTILRGISDVLGAMRGISDFYLDLHDDPEPLLEAGARITQLHQDLLDLHFSLVPPKLGGYGHIFGYWAPGRTTVIQEDAMGLCSPAVYRDRFREFGAAIVRHLGAYVIFHLHSTGFRHYRDVLEIPGIAGLQITVELNGPPLIDMVPALRFMLERSRLILMVDAWHEQLREVLPKLPREGLYLMVSDRFIRSDAEFDDLAALL